MLRSAAALLLSALPMAPVLAQRVDVAAGEFRAERPTLVSLGFEWRITGDDNRNARVDVRYRVKGANAWREGLPMLRLHGEQVLGGKPRHGDPHFYDYVAPNMFAGSLLNLDPDTEYEARFTLVDPDGVAGQAEQTVTLRTPRRPAAICRWQDLSCLSRWLCGPQDRAGLHRADGGLLSRLRPVGPFDRVAAACPAGRHDPCPCRPLQG